MILFVCNFVCNLVFRSDIYGAKFEQSCAKMSAICIKTAALGNEKARKHGLFPVLVEARGVEPLSENLLARLSTSVAYVLKFPLRGSHGQDPRFGSFIKSHMPQSLSMLVPHLNDARIRRRGQLRADASLLTQRRVRN